MVENKTRTHSNFTQNQFSSYLEKNKSDASGFPFVLKSNNMSINQGEKSRSRMGRESDI